MPYFILFILVIIGWAGFIWYKYQSVAKDAVDVYAAHADQSGDYAALEEAEFIDIYKRTHAPLFHVFTLIGSVVVMCLLPIIYYIAASFWNFIWHLSGRPEDLSEGFLPWLLYIAFMCLVGIAGIAALVARLYYYKRAKPFEIEIKNALQSKGL